MPVAGETCLSRLFDCFAKLPQKRRHHRVRIVNFVLWRKRLDGQITAVTGFADDRDEPGKIGWRIAFVAKRTLLDLPVDGVWRNHCHVLVWIFGFEIARIDDRPTPFRIDSFDQRQQLLAGLEEIAVVLNANDDSEFLAMLGTLN